MMNKLEKLVGTAVYRKLPVTIQITEGKPVPDVFQFSMKSASARIYQTEERVLISPTKPISQIIVPISENDTHEVF